MWARSLTEEVVWGDGVPARHLRVVRRHAHSSGQVRAISSWGDGDNEWNDKGQKVEPETSPGSCLFAVAANWSCPALIPGPWVLPGLDGGCSHQGEVT